MPTRPHIPTSDPRSRSRRPDSVRRFDRRTYTDHYVKCVECQQKWRYGCQDCAELFADYHRGAFDGHTVTISSFNRYSRIDDIPRGTSNLFGRY